jgi:predicted ester cyclase
VDSQVTGDQSEVDVRRPGQTTSFGPAALVADGPQIVAFTAFNSTPGLFGYFALPTI